MAAPAPNAPVRCYPIAEFCRLYGIGRTTAWKERTAGRLIVHEVAGKLAVFAEDAEAWRDAWPVASVAEEPKAARRGRKPTRASRAAP
jgi:hypothetical protein